MLASFMSSTDDLSHLSAVACHENLQWSRSLFQPLILADEPTAALDPKSSQEIMDILLSLKSPDRLIVIATHNPLIWERADLIIKMEDL
ncbi:hypothetical protein WQ51_02555 [Streptococcus suis]|nr:hypothetical protein WQ51_02555 [Streptococcus suis]